MVIAQLISIDLLIKTFVTVSVMVYGKLKLFVDKQFNKSDDFFCRFNEWKMCKKHAIRRQESSSVSDSANSIII